MELAAVGEHGVVIPLPLNTVVLLGRLPGSGIVNPRVSRKHCTLECTAKAGRHLLELTVLKETILVKAGCPREERCVLQAADKAWLQAGDVLYLVQDGTQLLCGFEIRKQFLTTQQVKELGGREDAKLHKGTTHVVARFDTDASEAAMHLRQCNSFDFGNQDPCNSILPNGIHFVTREFLSASIAKGERQPEELYWICLQQSQRKSPASFLPRAPAVGTDNPCLPPDPATTADPEPTGQQEMHIDQADALSTPSTSSSALVAGGAAGQDQETVTAVPPDIVKEAPTNDREAQPGVVQEAPEMSRPPAWSHATQIDPWTGTTQLDPWAASTQLDPWVGATQLNPWPGVTQLARPSGPRYGEWVVATSGARVLVPTVDEVCPPGQWGAGGRWIEPWDEAAARDGLKRLLDHWHGRDKAVQHSFAAGHDSDGDEGSSEGEVQLQEAGLVSLANENGVCSHPACSRQPMCMVEVLRDVREKYPPGPLRNFKVKAINNAIRAVESLVSPLVEAQDLDKMRLGRETHKKLAEILATGSHRRTTVLASDERHQALSLFQRVWGAGQKVSEAWYIAGYRSLDDVRRRASLTETQKLGLKYFDDFERRIPRAEVEQCRGLVADTAAEALADMTGKPLADVKQQVHCRVMGSYLRGKADCGDMDILLAAPPSISSDVASPALLAAVLERLMQRGFVTRDVPISRARLLAGGEQEQERCTYMGIWRGPSSPCARRIDIKVYPWALLALGVNFFGSSRDFCRALRYWCNTPNSDVKERARRANPGATAFKLSDNYLVPIKRGRRATGSEVLGPYMTFTDETEIFAAVGLPYIPPHMREV